MHAEHNRLAKGYRTSLAEAAGCKKPFVSQVLLSHVHFTPDHAAGLAEFWRFSASESQFFVDLVIHLPRTSPMTEANHSHWRQRALFNIQSQDPSALHYSLVFALAPQDLETLKEMVRSFLETTHQIIGPSPSQELACLNVDLFVV